MTDEPTPGADDPSPDDLAAAGPAGPAFSGPTDEELAVRLRGGDISAGRILVDRFYPVLSRYLRRLVNNDHTAEELLQQTWVSVLEHIHKFDPKSNPGGFKAWLFRIAKNKTNDHWRSKGRERKATDGLKLVQDEGLPAAGEKMHLTEQHVKLKAAIEMLPEAQKQVVVMRYYANMKFVDISKQLGCPLNTALGRMHKAVLKLRQLMEGEGV